MELSQPAKLSPRRRYRIQRTPTVPLFIQHPHVLEEGRRTGDVLGSPLSYDPFKAITSKLSLIGCLKGKCFLLLSTSIFNGLVVFPFKTLFFFLKIHRFRFESEWWEGQREGEAEK